MKSDPLMDKKGTPACSGQRVKGVRPTQALEVLLGNQIAQAEAVHTLQHICKTSDVRSSGRFQTAKHRLRQDAAWAGMITTGI